MSQEIEIWKAVKGYKDGFYDGLYEISNLGRFKLLPRKLNCKGGSRMTKEKIVLGSDSHGYRRVHLKKDRISLQIDIHILVATAFHPNPENKPTVNHKDAVKHNNRADNLEWATYQEQIEHQIRLGIGNRQCGINRKNAKLDEDKVREIRILHSTGVYSHRDLAKTFGVAYGVIGQIVRREKWKHVA